MNRKGNAKFLQDLLRKLSLLYVFRRGRRKRNRERERGGRQFTRKTGEQIIQSPWSFYSAQLSPILRECCRLILQNSLKNVGGAKERTFNIIAFLANSGEPFSRTGEFFLKWVFLFAPVYTYTYSIHNTRIGTVGTFSAGLRLFHIDLLREFISIKVAQIKAACKEKKELKKKKKSGLNGIQKGGTFTVLPHPADVKEDIRTGTSN